MVIESMSSLRRRTIVRISNALYLATPGEKLQLVEGLLIPSFHVLTEKEDLACQEVIQEWTRKPATSMY